MTSRQQAASSSNTDVVSVDDDVTLNDLRRSPKFVSARAELASAREHYRQVYNTFQRVVQQHDDKTLSQLLAMPARPTVSHNELGATNVEAHHARVVVARTRDIISSLEYHSQRLKHAAEKMADAQHAYALAYTTAKQQILSRRRIEVALRGKVEASKHYDARSASAAEMAARLRQELVSTEAYESASGARYDGYAQLREITLLLRAAIKHMDKAARGSGPNTTPDYKRHVAKAIKLVDEAHQLRAVAERAEVFHKIQIDEVDVEVYRVKHAFKQLRSEVDEYYAGADDAKRDSQTARMNAVQTAIEGHLKEAMAEVRRYVQRPLSSDEAVERNKRAFSHTAAADLMLNAEEERHTMKVARASRVVAGILKRYALMDADLERLRATWRQFEAEHPTLANNYAFRGKVFAYEEDYELFQKSYEAAKRDRSNVRRVGTSLKKAERIYTRMVGRSVTSAVRRVRAELTHIERVSGN